jgi:hypothetical protein
MARDGRGDVGGILRAGCCCGAGGDAGGLQCRLRRGGFGGGRACRRGREGGARAGWSGFLSALWKALHKADYAKPAIMESSRGGCGQEAVRTRLGSGWHPRKLDIISSVS